MCSLWRAPRLSIYTEGAEYEDFDCLWDQGSVARGSVSLAQHGQAPFSEAGLQEVPLRKSIVCIELFQLATGLPPVPAQ